MCWVNGIVTTSWEIGAEYVLTTPRPPSGLGSENEPLTRWPVAVLLGSATVSVASPAVETTSAVVVAVESLSAPGVNAPKEAGAPRVSARVAGTVPPTGPVTGADRTI